MQLIRVSLLFTMLFIAFIGHPDGAFGDILLGTLGSSAHWGSGWLDLKNEVSFKKGERLRLQVGGTAKKVIVRLLQDINAADEPRGVEGGMRDVPPDRIVEVVLEADHPGTRQISVHGGPRAWSFTLGADNGPATLESVELVPSRTRMPYSQ